MMRKVGTDIADATIEYERILYEKQEWQVK
jgi:hypothetical protein